MIRLHERSTPKQAGREFKEWASLFSGEIFVKISIYVDESGTHDPEGNQPGSKYPMIAGYAAHQDEWVKFCGKWKVVLNKYKAPYFHFREWAAASAAVRHKKKETLEIKKNPFYGWTIKRLDGFLIELARVAGAGNKIPLAGSIRIPAFNKLKADLKINNPSQIELGTNPYKYCMGEFFHIYHKETYLMWGEFEYPVTFFFDHSDDPEWKSAVHEVFDAFRKKDSRMKEIVFANKKEKPHLPLQAADMLAYRLRQLAQNIHEKNLVVEKLDNLLLQNLLNPSALERRNKFHNENPNYRSYAIPG